MSAQPASRMPEIPRELPLVGRRHDLERLYRLFGHEDRAEPVVLVSGDAGVGKSRLASVVEREARRRGWTVASGRAYPVETGMPYNLLSDAFLPIFRSFDEATLTVLTRGTSGDLRRLFPALGAPDGPIEDWDPTESRTRLFWSFTEFVKRLSERGPLLIVAEDLHWADASSLSLLHFLARQLQGEPIRILGTYSSDYGRDTEGLNRLERSLSSLDILASHRLLPLEPDAVQELISTVFQVSGPPLHEFAAHLYDWTHGNPYFLEETLKTLVTTGRLHYRDGTWLGWEVHHLDLPGSVRDALLRRLGSLSAPARTSADLVAVSGGRASVRLVGRVGQIEQGALLDAVEELTAQSVVVEREEGREVILEVRHPMLREALYQSLGPSRRQLLHRKLAEGLEELHRAGATPVDQLAYHFTRGGSSGEDARAARYLVEAGRSALRRHADREGVAYLEAAVERYPTSPDDVENAADLPSREIVQAELARGLARLGRYADAATLWKDLLAAARGSQDVLASAQALRHLGLLAYWSGRKEEALDSYALALAEIAGRGLQALEARIHLAAGVALQELGRADEARDRIEASLELARALDEPTLVGRGHRALALLYTWLGEPEEARRHGWQAVEIADRVGDHYVRFWGRWALASLEGLTGNTGELSRLMGQAGQVADQLRSPVLRLWTAELEVEYLWAVGDWDGALAQGERAIALATSLSQTSLLPRLLVWTSTVYVGRGDLVRACELVDRAWAVAGLDEGGGRPGDVHGMVAAHIGRANCLLAEGRYTEAAEVGRAGLKLADATGYVFWSLHMLLPVIAEALIRDRDLEGAMAIGRRLREAGQRIGHRLASAWADACEALVSWISGDLEKGLELLQNAAEALDAIPLKYDAARVRRQMAGRLAELGKREEALAELRTVHETFGSLGAQPELERTRDMFRELGSRAPSRVEAEGTAELTAREWDVAVRVADRLSNKVVAKSLGIAPRTVTTHLSNIYRKLGIGSRGELVDLVREARLPGRPTNGE
jgi:DNA-binding CsgD family transcriptional regulator